MLDPEADPSVPWVCGQFDLPCPVGEGPVMPVAGSMAVRGASLYEPVFGTSLLCLDLINSQISFSPFSALLQMRLPASGPNDFLIPCISIQEARE